MGWRFNTEFGLQVAPEVAFDYLDASGVTTRLGVYRPPAGLVAFEMTKSADQQGSMYPDAVIRQARCHTTDQLNAPSPAPPTFLGRASAHSSRAPLHRESLCR
jgi:hypothetical protein